MLKFLLLHYHGSSPNITLNKRFGGGETQYFSSPYVDKPPFPPASVVIDFAVEQ